MALTKAAIYEATTSILIEGGLDALNMDQVAEAADIAKGTIYRYFKSKLELLRFVREQSVQSLTHLWMISSTPRSRRRTNW